MLLPFNNEVSTWRGDPGPQVCYNALGAHSGRYFSITALVRTRTALRMSASVEFSALIESRVPFQVTVGGVGGLSCRIGGATGKGAGSTTGWDTTVGD